MKSQTGKKTEKPAAPLISTPHSVLDKFLGRIEKILDEHDSDLSPRPYEWRRSA